MLIDQILEGKNNSFYFKFKTDESTTGKRNSHFTRRNLKGTLLSQIDDKLKYIINFKKNLWVADS